MPHMKEPSISIVIIVKNEAHNISGFFNSIIGIADELIIADTGSTDDTIQRIQEQNVPYSVHFYEKRFPEPFHYGIANNYVIDLATKDYVFKLDADERLTEKFKDIRSFLREHDPLVVSFRREEDLVPHYIDWQERLFKNGRGIYFEENPKARVDMGIVFEAKALAYPYPFLHLQKMNMKKRAERTKSQIKLDVAAASRTVSTAREMVRGMFAFYYIFKKIYITRQTWKDGFVGLRYAIMRAWYKFLTHFYVALKPRVNQGI